ncbi:MAG: hypothetical protein JOZ96_18165 [Acidobacteria bacterium]|nr:hypothetical protein [Acidobacteriota bacterium]
MRLLVYGGTLYAERRRIGEWPPSVSPQFLQSTAGLSELRSAYGVGILDDSPFVIFRMMLMHERRNYPFTVLLDPGERWADFGWNGARLLWLLFDRAAEKGSALIKEPESFQSAADLKGLLNEVLKEDAPPPEPEDEAAERGGERFLHLWTGALTHEGPLVLGFGDAELGLAERPRDAEMARRLEQLPLSLRGGLGWVMGGNEEYAATLGTKLILDNSRTAEANASEHIGRLIESGRGWLSDWKEVEGRVRVRSGEEEEAEVSVEGSVEDEKLKDLFSKPLVTWQREQRDQFPAYTTGDLLEDVSCIRRLLPPVAGAGVAAPPAPSEHLKDVLEGRHRGPFNQTIEGLYEFLSSFSVRPLDPDSTRHYLRKLYDRGGELEVEEGRLDREAAIAFTVERGLYPSDGPVPQSIWFEVLKRLLQGEGSSEEIRQRLLAGWGQLADEEKGELLQVALGRSAELPEGMGCWAENLSKPESLEAASQVVWLHAGEGRPAWNRDYLLFGNDPGGARLLELHPDLVEGVVAEALRALKSDAAGPAERLYLRAHEWLVAAGRTELRRAMPLETRESLTDKGLDNWRGLRDLKRAFNGPTGVAGAADPEEQKYLAGELWELSNRLADGVRAPFLRDIVGLFDLAEAIKSNAGMRDALDRLASLKPNLAGEAGENWVLGWREVASQEVFANTHGQRYWHKFREEAAGYFAQSDQAETFVKLRELSEEGADDPLKELLTHLLFEGEDEREKAYGRKLNAARSEIEKDEKVREALQAVLKQAVADGHSLDGMFRRLAPYEKTLETIRQALNEEQRARLKGAEQQFRDAKLEDYQKQVSRLLSGRDGKPPDSDAFLNLKKILSAGGKAEAELFNEAMTKAVAELLTSPYKKVFMERFGENTRTIKAIKDGLLNVGVDSVLDEAIADYRFEKLRDNLEWYLCGGGDGDKLGDKLEREKNQEVLTAAADAVMASCLKDSSKWQALYRETMVTTTKDGERRLRLSRKEPFVKFFGYLSRDMQQRVLRAAFNQHRDLFHEMTLRAYEQRQKYDKAIRENRRGEENPLRDAVLTFLTEPEGSEGYVARIKLITGARLNRDKLDKYLRKFKKPVPAEDAADGRPAPEPEQSEAPVPATPEQEATPRQGWRGWLPWPKKTGG